MIPLPSLQRLGARAAEIGRQWSELPPARTRAVLTAMIERVEVRVDQVDIHLRPTGLTASSSMLGDGTAISNNAL
jgi:hypothetical protein